MKAEITKPKPKIEKVYIQYSKFLENGLPETPFKHREWVTKWIKSLGCQQDEYVVIDHVDGVVYGLAVRTSILKYINAKPL